MWNIRFIIKVLKYEIVPPMGRVFIATYLETDSLWILKEICFNEKCLQSKWNGKLYNINHNVKNGPINLIKPTSSYLKMTQNNLNRLRMKNRSKRVSCFSCCILVHRSVFECIFLLLTTIYFYKWVSYIIIIHLEFSNSFSRIQSILDGGTGLSLNKQFQW